MSGLYFHLRLWVTTKCLVFPRCINMSLVKQCLVQIFGVSEETKRTTIEIDHVFFFKSKKTFVLNS